MKKALTSLCVLALVLVCIFALPTAAQAATEGDYKYSVSNEEAAITAYNGDGGDITIPATLGGYPVTTIGDDAFYDCDSLTGVTIPDSVTTIGDYAFYICSSLRTVTIPESVTVIGDDAFCGCTSLTYNAYDNGKYLGNSDNPYVALIEPTSINITSCQIAPSTKVIGDSALSYCDSLTNVTIGDSVTSIGESVFRYCGSLTAIRVSGGNANFSSDEHGVLFNKDKTTLIQAPEGMAGSYTIPDRVTAAGNYAFAYCNRLTSVTITDSVTTIGVGAFEYCTSLTSVTIPDSVTTIGGYAFASCYNLTSVTIGDSVTTIDDSAFENCDNLTGFWVSSGNADFSSDECGVLFNKDKTTLIQAPGGLNGSYTIPDSVTTIRNRAFSSCTSLTSVTIGDSVTTIGEDAFSWCESLTSVTIGDSVTSIGEFVFYRCSSLTDVYYNGTEAQWNDISVGNYNSALLNATIHFAEVHTHSYTTTVTAPTCTEQGYTTYTCACGDTYKANYVNATGHSYNSGKVTKAATCKATGVKTYTCKNCPTTKTETIAKLTTHTYTNNCDTACDVCGAKRTITHSYDAGKVTKAATCKAAGVKTYTCKVCKATKAVAIAKLTTHTYKTTTTKATLSKDGKIVKKCTVCGKVASTTAIKRVKTVKLSATSYVYNGKAKTPTVTVKDSVGKTLKKGTDYTVTYASGRKNVGTYKVTIKFKGNYSGTKTLTFKILPKAASINKLTAKSKAITVKLNRVTTQSTGYEIQYSTSSKFTSAKTVNVASYKTSSKTISGLKKGKKYYVRVRTYKTVGGTKIYSAWSSAKSIKTK